MSAYVATFITERLHTRKATAFEANSYREKPQARSATFGKIDAEKRTAELSFSSNVELERWPGFTEKLSHDTGAVDMSRLESGASLLFNHDWDAPIGVVETASVENGKGRATVRFGNSQRAKEIFEDVRDGILKGVSVGYRILDFREEKRPEKRDTLVTATRWQPYELSIVTVPADISVGVGRNAKSPEPIFQQESPNHHAMTRAQIIAALQKRGITVPENATDADLAALLERSLVAPGDNDAATRSAVEAVTTRIRTILELGKKYGEREFAADFLNSGGTIEAFREALLEKVQKRTEALNNANTDIGLNEGERAKFSFLRLLSALDPQSGNQRAAMDAARFELDACAAAAAKISHRSVKGTVIPLDVLRSPLVGRRAGIVSIASGTATDGMTLTGTGGNVIATTLLAQSFVELLMNKAVIANKATVLGGLLGKIEIPKQLTGASGYWLGEDDSAPESDITFGQFALNPHTCATKVEITRQMLKQPSIDVEALCRFEIAKRIALTIDRAGAYGDGTANSPVGIKSTSGVSAIAFAGAVPTYAELVQMETDVALANIDPARSLYIMNPGMRGSLKTTKKFPTSADSMTLWDPGNTVNGYATDVSNQVAGNDILYGDFSELLFGMWGGLELTFDPYSGSDKGRLRLVAMQDVDFGVKRPLAFVFGTH